MHTALYLRTSTDRQAGGASSQLKALLDWAKSKGISNYVVYEDIGYSGAKESRPALDRMMAEVRAGNVNMVAVLAFSRFARSIKHLLAALEEFQKLKISFVSLTEAIDSSTSMGLALLTIIGAINALERALIRERILAGLARAKASGTPLGRPRTRNSGAIKELSLKGLSQREIARLLGVSKTTVMRALREVPRKVGA